MHFLKLSFSRATLICLVILVCSAYGGLYIINKKYPAPTQSFESGRYIAISFDDGPYGKPTEQLLDILRDKKVPATFFVIGKNTLQYPDIVRRAIAEGHVVGNHTYDHKKIHTLSNAQLREEFLRDQSIIAEVTGKTPALFRAPYGITTSALFSLLKQQSMTYVGWTIDPNDWNYKGSPTDKIVAHVLKKAAPNGIILLHDGRDTHINYPRDNTIAALPIIIDSLRAKGYRFVTIDVLKGRRAYQ